MAEDKVKKPRKPRKDKGKKRGKRTKNPQLQRGKLEFKTIGTNITRLAGIIGSTAPRQPTQFDLAGLIQEEFKKQAKTLKLKNEPHELEQGQEEKPEVDVDQLLEDREAEVKAREKKNLEDAVREAKYVAGLDLSEAEQRAELEKNYRQRQERYIAKRDKVKEIAKAGDTETKKILSGIGMGYDPTKTLLENKERYLKANLLNKGTAYQVKKGKIQFTLPEPTKEYQELKYQLTIRGVGKKDRPEAMPQVAEAKVETMAREDKPELQSQGYKEQLKQAKQSWEGEVEQHRQTAEQLAKTQQEIKLSKQQERLRTAKLMTQRDREIEALKLNQEDILRAEREAHQVALSEMEQSIASMRQQFSEEIEQLQMAHQREREEIGRTNAEIFENYRAGAERTFDEQEASRQEEVATLEERLRQMDELHKEALRESEERNAGLIKEQMARYDELQRKYQAQELQNTRYMTEMEREMRDSEAEMKRNRNIMRAMTMATGSMSEEYAQKEIKLQADLEERFNELQKKEQKRADDIIALAMDEVSRERVEYNQLLTDSQETDKQNRRVLQKQREQLAGMTERVKDLTSMIKESEQMGAEDMREFERIQEARDERNFMVEFASERLKQYKTRAENAEEKLAVNTNVYADMLKEKQAQVTKAKEGMTKIAGKSKQQYVELLRAAEREDVLKRQIEETQMGAEEALTRQYDLSQKAITDLGRQNLEYVREAERQKAEQAGNILGLEFELKRQEARHKEEMDARLRVRETMAEQRGQSSSRGEINPAYQQQFVSEEPQGKGKKVWIPRHRREQRPPSPPLPVVPTMSRSMSDETTISQQEEGRRRTQLVAQDLGVILPPEPVMSSRAIGLASVAGRDTWSRRGEDTTITSDLVGPKTTALLRETIATKKSGGIRQPIVLQPRSQDLDEGIDYSAVEPSPSASLVDFSSIYGNELQRGQEETPQYVEAEDFTEISPSGAENVVNWDDVVEVGGGGGGGGRVMARPTISGRGKGGRGSNPELVKIEDGIKQQLYSISKMRDPMLRAEKIRSMKNNLTSYPPELRAKYGKRITNLRTGYVE